MASNNLPQNKGIGRLPDGTPIPYGNEALDSQLDALTRDKLDTVNKMWFDLLDSAHELVTTQQEDVAMDLNIVPEAYRLGHDG